MRFTTFGRAWPLAFLLVCLPALTVFSQDHRTDEKRPKVALVLSGGGALGVSHIGVLKALEELRIPIDSVTGTSMGAIVGGLYASGLSPAEIDEWFRNADWHFLLSDSIPRESESFRNKERQFNVNQGITFRVAEKGELKLPAGLVVGRNIMAALRELTLPVRHITNFDKLPIPFRAVATDMETGDMVVLKDGDLVEAVRASMSVPAIFTPQRIRGRFLVDGGSTNNLPIDVAQQLSPDVVIAVNVSEPLKKASQLDTAPAIANQVVSILLKRQMADQIAKLDANDVHLRINIENLGPTEFEKAARSIDTGYEQTMKQRDLLSALAVSPREFQAYLARQRLPRSSPIMVTHLQLQTPEGEFAHRLPRSVEFDVKDRNRYTKLQTMISDLGEMQEFEVGDYEVVGQEGDYGLLVKARKKKSGPNQLNIGLDLGYSSTDESNFSLLLSYSMTELNSLGAEWTTYLSLGNRTRILTEWYQPITRERRFFVAPYGLFGSEFIDGRDENHDPLRFRLQTHLAGLDIGMRLWQAGEFRMGYARGANRISRRLGVDEDVPTGVDLGWAHADLTVDTLNAANFATKGTYGRVSFTASREELGASDNYNRIEGQFFHTMTIGKNTIVPRISAALGVGGGAVPLYDQTPLGGFLQLSGLPHGSLYGENAALAEVVFYRKIADMTPGIGRGVYAGFSLEAGEVWNRNFDPDAVTFAGSLFLGADTLAGPVYIGLGLAEDGEAAVYLQLGPLFRQGRHQR